MLSSEIKNKIQTLWDRLWGGGLSNPITAIENISYLLFMKRLEKFHPEVEDMYKWSNYNNLKDLELKDRINEVFAYIQNDLSDKDEPFAIEMKNAKFGISTPSLIEDCVKFIDEIFDKVEEEEKKNQHFQDIQGDVYEYLLKSTNEAGKNGQFRTPRHIIQMMSELVNPTINEPHTKICDVTSGSSGFLVGSYQYILKENSTYRELDEDNQLEKGLDGDKLDEDNMKKLRESTFFGFDIDATMVRIGMMNMMMHGISKPNIIHLNTLSEDYENYFKEYYLKQITLENLLKENPQKKGKDQDLNLSNKLPGSEEFSFILANPPFAGKVNSKTISKNLNRVYEIKEDLKKPQTLQTELLFLERIIYMLKKNGKAAVIVPEGVLSNSAGAYKKIREILMRDCDLEAVISLPSGVFNPYTAVKTSILLFTKKEFRSEKFNTKKVWFYGLDSDGYTFDNNRKKIKNDYPLPVLIEKYKIKDDKNNSNKDRKQIHFYVPISEIQNNDFELNYNLYKEFVFEEQSYEAPKVLLEKLLLLEKDINNNIQTLNKMFNEN